MRFIALITMLILLFVGISTAISREVTFYVRDVAYFTPVFYEALGRNNIYPVPALTDDLQTMAYYLERENQLCTYERGADTRECTLLVLPPDDVNGRVLRLSPTAEQMILVGYDYRSKFEVGSISRWLYPSANGGVVRLGNPVINPIINYSQYFPFLDWWSDHDAELYSVEAIKRDSSDLLDIYLYHMDTDTFQQTSLLNVTISYFNTIEVLDAAFSPDGQRLAVTFLPDSVLNIGLVVIDIATQSVLFQPQPDILGTTYPDYAAIRPSTRLAFTTPIWLSDDTLILNQTDRFSGPLLFGPLHININDGTIFSLADTAAYGIPFTMNWLPEHLHNGMLTYDGRYYFFFRYHEESYDFSMHVLEMPLSDGSVELEVLSGIKSMCSEPYYEVTMQYAEGLSSYVVPFHSYCGSIG